MGLASLMSLELGPLSPRVAGGDPEPAMPSSPSGIFVILGIFAVALVLALILTPWIKRLARRRGLVDFPSARKIHKNPLPRIGGVAIYGSFLLCYGLYLFFSGRAGLDSPDPLQTVGLLAGASMAFGLGLWDDLRRLGPRAKFLVQIATAVVAFSCGIGIHAVELPWFSRVSLGVLALPVTVFWFVLVINAINLIDGLDGLAAGVTVFSSLTLLVLCLINRQLLIAASFAALAGATLGFLRYNFNPATIFMGDGGSYFIGYTLASLSILGSVKSQASVTILIPILAMGLPLMDTLWSTVRRFLQGHAIFRPDRDHLHHRLLKLGYTHRRAVLLLYAVTAATGVASLLLVHTSDHQAALILAAVGVGFAVFIRKLGYVDYLTSEKLLGWLRDVTGAMGVERGQRTFLGLQMAISDSETVAEAWDHIVEAVQYLGMDYVSLEFTGGPRREGARLCALPMSRGHSAEGGSRLDPERTLRIAFPIGTNGSCIAQFTVAKDIVDSNPEYHTLRRMEHLRRTVDSTLLRLCGAPIERARRPLAVTTETAASTRPGAAHPAIFLSAEPETELVAGLSRPRESARR